MSFLSDVVAWAARRTDPKNVPTTSSAVTSNARGQAAKANVQLFRNWAEHSEWIRAAIGVRKSQVSAAEWDIVAFDPDKPVSQSLKDQVKGLFDRPNAATDSFRSFIEPVIEDILVLDAGVIEKVRNLRGSVSEMWGVDGGKMRVSSTWSGEASIPRYFWYPDGFLRASFTNDDIVYIMENPATYRPVGLSKLETLRLTIESELQGNTYNHRQVTQAAPDGMLDLGEGARPEQVDTFKSYWAAEVAGRGAMAFIGGTKNAKFIPFRNSNRDMQFLEWQIYLVRKICAVFGLSPQDLGVTFDVNRSNSEVQQENTDDRGIRPLLALLQDYFTREVVWDPSFGGPDNNLAFRFTKLNLRETLNQARVMEITLAKMPWRAVNEVRKEQGLEPWGPEFDEPMVVTPTGAVRLSDVPTAAEARSKPAPAGQQGAPQEGAASSPAGSKGN